jgi:DNA polymerase/3'-5' exonuclease PolX
VGISDRIPRPVIPGEKREFNKRMVEKLANQCYGFELAGASAQKVWAYRKAAWAIEDLEQDVRLVYHQLGRRGLEGITDVGQQMAGVIEKLLKSQI